MAKTREPVFNIPFVVTALVLLMVGVHLLRGFIDSETDIEWLVELAFIPARFIAALGGDPITVLEQAAAASPGEDSAMRLALARAVINGDGVEGYTGGLMPWTLVTYALLHGGTTHLVINMVWLTAFGSPLARRFGAPRFLVFMLLTAVAGALAHLLTHWSDPMPLVGASAAISGAMAGAALFAFQPGAPLSGFRLNDDFAYRLPALPLRAVLKDRRVMGFLGVWVAVNLLAGVSSLTFGLDGVIAWQAHFGGFIAGLLLFRFLDPKILQMQEES